MYYRGWEEFIVESVFLLLISCFRHPALFCNHLHPTDNSLMSRAEHISSKQRWASWWLTNKKEEKRAALFVKIGLSHCALVYFCKFRFISCLEKVGEDGQIVREKDAWTRAWLWFQFSVLSLENKAKWMYSVSRGYESENVSYSSVSGINSCKLS